MLSLLHNSVVSKPNYRLFVIHKFPNLKILDFKKVKDKVEISIFFLRLAGIFQEFVDFIITLAVHQRGLPCGN
jgi:hypothetical protein